MSNPLQPLLGIGIDAARGLLTQVCCLCLAASGERLLCRACESELPGCGQGCPVCALPTQNGAVCGACIGAPPYFDATRAAFSYAYPVDGLVHALKYRGQLALAGLFAHKLRERIGDSAGAQLIVPLPLHPARLAERGFNQAVEIARVLARLTGIPMDTQLATRVRNTAPQTDLPWQERVANMRQAFACGRDLAGVSVAVVDDVMTTGATLDEFAKVLKRAGAARVENWVVARTPRV